MSSYAQLFKIIFLKYFLAVCLFINCSNAFLSASEHCIVFVHIGNRLPSHVGYALSQARVFNPDCPIILIANQAALENFSIKDPRANIITIACETIHKTEQHDQFIQRTHFNTYEFEGLWRYSSERFLYLNDLAKQLGLKNIFHLENDVMLYANLEELLPVFQNQYKGIAAVFDNDERCIPSFVYIPNQEVSTLLASCFCNWASSKYTDMQMLPIFRNLYGTDAIDNLPIITKEYVNDHPLISPAGHVAQNKEKYCQNIDLFHSIFDAAAIGQYFDGDDRRYHTHVAGFINESCVFNPALLTYEWCIDELGRKIPYAIYANKKYRINNLHIHSKRLELFISNEEGKIE